MCDDKSMMGREWSSAQAASFGQDDALGHFQFEVGGISIYLSGVRLANGPHSVLKRFCVAEGVHDIQLRVRWCSSLNVRSELPLFDSGTTWRLYENDEGFQFDFSASSFGAHPYKRLFTDRHFLRAALELNEESFASLPSSVSPLEYPLDELLIMHRLTQEQATELHGTGIVRGNGEANLFIGHSGAGKSTTTRLWTAVEDVEVLSDDRIIVRRDPSVMETPCDAGSAAGQHEILRLRDCSASRSNLSAQDDNERCASRGGKHTMRMYGTPWHGEAMYASPNSALLTRIFVLEHGHGNIITPLTPSQAVAELFARSFVPFHRHEYVDSALVFLEELANAVPVYRYAFEPDQRAVEKIRNFHD
jgi:hypothetical protein